MIKLIFIFKALIVGLRCNIRDKINSIKIQWKYSTHIGRKCKISNDLKCGNNVRIGECTTIGKNVIFGNNNLIGGYCTLSNIQISDNSHIDGGVKITGKGKGKIIIGKESYIGINNVLDWSDNIIIGNFVHIAGPSTSLWTHRSAKQVINGISLSDKNETHRPVSPIVIEDNVYIGGNCTVYPGITIGHHSIVAPNSVVNKDVEPYSLVGGVPIKFIKKISI